MDDASGSLPADKAQREQLLTWYWLEEYLFADVHKRFKQGERIGYFDFYSIIYWKRNASKKNIKKGLDKLRIKPWQLLRQVEAAGGPKQKLKVLRRVNGIGIAIASAIMAVCYPEHYTVVDSYVLTEYNESRKETVEGWVCLSLDSLTDERYLEYNKWCKELSHAWDCSLRDVDRILWTKVWKKGVVPPKSQADQQ